MNLMLSDEEVQVLADAVKNRIDELLRGIAKADSRAFKDQLIAESKTLEGIYERLGCTHEEWNEAKGCEFNPT